MCYTSTEVQNITTIHKSVTQVNTIKSFGRCRRTLKTVIILKIILSSGNDYKIDFNRMKENYHQMLICIEESYLPNDFER